MWSVQPPLSSPAAFILSSLCLLCVFHDSLGVHLFTILIFCFLFVIMWWAVNVSRWAAQGKLNPQLCQRSCFTESVFIFYFLQEFVILTVSKQHSKPNLTLIWRPAEKQASFHFAFVSQAANGHVENKKSDEYFLPSVCPSRFLPVHKSVPTTHIKETFSIREKSFLKPLSFRVV